MAQQCPLLFRQVDATVTRINTLFVILGLIGFLLTQNSVIMILLIGDFILRLSGYKQLSPIHKSSLYIQKKFEFSVKMEDVGAKRLASFFGLGFMIAIALSDWFGFTLAVTIISTIFLGCAALDLIYGYCIACKIYYVAKKIYPKAFL
jgi:hypothetical protein